MGFSFIEEKKDWIHEFNLVKAVNG